MATDPAGFYGFRTDGSRQYPVWMTGGIAAPRPARTQAKPEFVNMPPMAAPAAPVNALAPQPVDMGQGGMQAEGAGMQFGAPAGPNQTWGGYLAALGLGGFGNSGSVATGQMPGDVTGTGFAQQMADISAQMGPTAGSAPLGAVSSEQLGDIAGGADGPSGGGMDAGAAGGGMEAGGGYGGMDGAGGMYRGGIVTANRLQGPDPRGPDDGYVAMNRNEGVLTAEAVRHYGPGIVARLNKLAVPKKAFARR